MILIKHLLRDLVWIGQDDIVEREFEERHEALHLFGVRLGAFGLAFRAHRRAHVVDVVHVAQHVVHAALARESAKELLAALRHFDLHVHLLFFVRGVLWIAAAVRLHSREHVDVVATLKAQL